MRIEQILSRFEEVSEDHEGYVARCPAHKDGDPSLRIFVGEDRKIRLTCRAGCKTEDVVKDAGLAWRDLFDAEGQAVTVPKERPKAVGPTHTAPLMMYVSQRAGYFPGSSAAIYAHDRFGIQPDDAQRLMLGVSYPGTGFAHTGTSFESFPRLTVPLLAFSGVVHGLQGRDLSGSDPMRWVGLTNPEGHAWGKYGYMPGSAGYDAVLVTEGPGDGLSVVAVGYDAVVIRGASMVNNPELVAELASGLAALGKKIVVCGDNDESGLRFNKTLHTALKPHGLAVHELRIPDHGPKTDVTAWREATSEFPGELHHAVKSARPIPEMEALLVDAATGALIPSAETAADALRLINEYAERYGTSEVLCASALVAFSGKTIKYAEGLGFLVWNGAVWVRSDKMARQQAHFMGASLQMAADGIGDSEQRKNRMSLAAKFMNTRPLDNVMTELKAIPDVQVDADVFDSSAHLLSFKNGTVDLRTGDIRPHDPADMLTVMIPVDYDPAAESPRWEQFLAEIFPNHPDMPAYIQRMTGYGITGETSEQCFAVLHGSGANGKSVLTDTTAKVFSALTKNTPFATFEAKQSGGIPNDIAALKDARLVMSSEGEAGAPMSEAVLKRITGGDEVTARFMRQEFFTYTPRYLILLATNHRPNFKGQDAGLWRRVKLIPFERFFAPDERDTELTRKLIAEAPGIIAWAVRGAIEWYRNGLQDPQAVKDATKEYKETSDALSGFLPGVFEKTGDAADKMLGSDAFNDYLEWCEAEHLPLKEQWRRQTFYRALDERGVPRRKTRDGITLFGIRKSVPTEDDTPAGPGIFSN